LWVSVPSHFFIYKIRFSNFRKIIDYRRNHEKQQNFLPFLYYNNISFYSYAGKLFWQSVGRKWCWHGKDWNYYLLIVHHKGLWHSRRNTKRECNF
jgi:hypothetical protein